MLGANTRIRVSETAITALNMGTLVGNIDSLDAGEEKQSIDVTGFGDNFQREETGAFTNYTLSMSGTYNYADAGQVIIRTANRAKVSADQKIYILVIDDIEVPEGRVYTVKVKKYSKKASTKEKISLDLEFSLIEEPVDITA